MTKNEVLNRINTNPGYIIKGLGNMYHHKFFVAVDGNMMNFFKTSRSANTYANKQNVNSWYDEYFQEMRGHSYEVFEISENELMDVSEDYNFWNDYLRDNMSYIHNSGNGRMIQGHANKLIINADLLTIVTAAIEEIEKDYTFTSFRVEEVKEAEINQHTNSTVEQQEEEEVPSTQISNNIEVIYNTEKNGIELKFADKPSEEVRANLKANGFRWSKYNKVWYVKDTKEARDFVEAYFNSSENSSNEVVETQDAVYPEIDINDIDSYTVDSELSKRENDGHWVFRSKERDHQTEIQATLQAMNDEVLEVLGDTKDAKIIYNAKRWLQSYKKRYYDWYMRKLRQDANNPSWIVTGAGGRNRNKDAKYQSAYDRLMAEYVHKLKPEYENKINSIKSQIRKAKKQEEGKALFEAIQQAKPIELKRSKGLVNYRARNNENIFEGGTSETTIYTYEKYSIIKTWGSWRIYKDGVEISENKYATLDTAKKVLSLQVS